MGKEVLGAFGRLAKIQGHISPRELEVEAKLLQGGPNPSCRPRRSGQIHTWGRDFKPANNSPAICPSNNKK